MNCFCLILLPDLTFHFKEQLYLLFQQTLHETMCFHCMYIEVYVQHNKQ